MREILHQVTVAHYELGDEFHANIPLLFLDQYPMVSVNAYLLHKATKGLKEQGLSDRASRLKQFLSQLLIDNNEWRFQKGLSDKHLKAEKVYKKIKDTYISGYLHKMHTQGTSFTRKDGLKASTINQHIETIRDYYNFCFTYGFCARNRDFSYVYEKYNDNSTPELGINYEIQEQYIDKESFARILGYQTAQSEFLKSRNMTLFSIYYDMGLRPHESIKHGNFMRIEIEKIIKKKAPMNKSAVLILSGKGRGTGKNRKVVIHPRTYQLLSDYLYKHLPELEAALGIKVNMCIFVNEFNGNALRDARYFNQLWKDTVDKYIKENYKYLTAYQVKMWRTKTIYALRHSFATNFVIDAYRNGEPIDAITLMQLMGHSKIDTTFCSYVHLASVLEESEALRNKAITILEEAINEDKKRIKSQIYN